MWLMEHLLATFLAMDMNEEAFIKEAPYVALPDAIRMYTKNRQLSHFEKTSDGEDISWLEFPAEVSTINQQAIDACTKHLGNHKPAVIGDETSLAEFTKHNKHLPEDYYRGCFRHLCQDISFDDYIRMYNDCSLKHEDKFKNKLTGETYTGAEFRKHVTELEQLGYFVLAKIAKEQAGITANNAWVQSFVIPALAAIYPKELLDNTCKFLVIDETYDNLISNGDFRKIDNENVTVIESLYELYDDVFNNFNINYKPLLSLDASDALGETAYF